MQPVPGTINSPQNTTKVVRLAENTAGRDFCVGDLHGMFDLLDKLLASVKFDNERDRLLSVGDLVDRGPASHRALYYLNQPWFHAIRGNHEQMLIDCHEHPDDLEMRAIWLSNGGEWWDEQPQSLRYSIYRRLSRLPLAMEVPTRRGLIGIVHADIPPGMDWPAFTAELDAGHEKVIAHALWSRSRVKLADTAGPIDGITEIYCGHNIVPSPVAAGNVHYIDTGAFLGSRGRLTLVDIQQGPDYRYSLSSAQ